MLVSSSRLASLKSLVVCWAAAPVVTINMASRRIMLGSLSRRLVAAQPSAPVRNVSHRCIAFLFSLPEAQHTDTPAPLAIRSSSTKWGIFFTGGSAVRRSAGTRLMATDTKVYDHPRHPASTRPLISPVRSRKDGAVHAIYQNRHAILA